MMPIVFNNLAVLSPVSPQGDGNLGQYISRASKPTFSILARQARPMARELENALTLPDASLKIKTEASAPAALHGSVLVLIQFDVCEEIRLDQLREIFSARTLEQPSFKHPAPGYVRYQRPPVVEPIEPLVLESGERLQGQIKYYDYGVLSVVLELPFSGDWDAMIRLGSRSEEHTSELQSRGHLVCRLLLEKKKR